MSEPTVDERIDRLDQAINTLAWFLVAAGTGLGEQDARAIEGILNGKPSPLAGAETIASIRPARPFGGEETGRA